MKLKHLLLALLICLPPASSGEQPRVYLRTSLGVIVVELYPAQAPQSVDNFLRYVRDGFYDGTIFHRVIANFMVQGGGFTVNFEQKKTRAPIQNEAGNGLKNVRGSIAMARTADPHSATAQFFINVADNAFLNHTAQAWGYAVFGRVVEGMEVVDRIQRVKVGPGGRFSQDVPVTPVVIERCALEAATRKTGYESQTSNQPR